MKALHCTHPGCDVVIQRPNPARKTTMCRAHANAAAARDPVKRQKAAATMRKVIAQPGYREQLSIKARVAMRRVMSDPAIRARYVESGRRLGYEHQGNLYRTHEERVETARQMVATKLAHIPLEYRDLYADLRRHNLSAAERFEAVRTEVDRDQQRYERTGQLPRTGGK